MQHVLALFTHQNCYLQMLGGRNLRCSWGRGKNPPNPYQAPVSPLFGRRSPQHEAQAGDAETTDSTTISSSDKGGAASDDGVNAEPAPSGSAKVEHSQPRK